MRCTTVNVKCTFKLGSEIIGCQVNLMYTDMSTTPLDILRTNESEISIEKDISIPDFKEINDVIVFDLRRDGNASSVRACRELTFDCTLASPSTTMLGR